MKNKKIKVAIVADWLTDFGGAESVLLSLMNIFPKAPIYTTIFSPEKMDKFVGREIQTSFLQKLPASWRKRHRMFLPILPTAIESLDLTSFDLVVSSSSFVAKGVITPPETLHICYCHTPARFLWGDWQKFLADYPLPKFIKSFLPPVLSRLRIWDKFSSTRPNVYIANSDFIAQRIAKFWRRPSEVLSPPVDTKRFQLAKKTEKENFFIFVGRLVAQKDIDFLVKAFTEMPYEELRIVGSGPMEKKLKRMASKAKNIRFLGQVSDKKLEKLYHQAQAIIFPHIEDAGIVPLESLASGTPVIAYQKGGVLTTLNSRVAVFFPEQTTKSLAAAVKSFRKRKFNPQLLHAHAEQFSRENFEKEFEAIVERELKKHTKKK